MRNIFLEKTFTKSCRESVPRPFPKKFAFIVCQFEDYRDILKLSCRPLASASNNFFWKTKRALELVSLRHFLYDFWRKIFLLLYSYSWSNFIIWLPLLREILDKICIASVCKPGCDIISFEINLIFLIKLFFLHDQIFKTKVKRAFKVK